MVYSQTIAILDDSGHLRVYVKSGGDWYDTGFSRDIVMDHCSFDENGILWLTGTGDHFLSSDCSTYLTWHSPLPGGHATDVSAQWGRIIINPNGGICEFNPGSGSWEQLSSTFGGIAALEYVNDEDEEVYKGAGFEFLGGHALLQSWNIDYDHVYTYPARGRLIYDITYYNNTVWTIQGPSNYPYEREIVSVENGEWYSQSDNNPEVYPEGYNRAIDATPGGNLVWAFRGQMDETHVIFNGTTAVTLETEGVRDLSVYDYNVNP
jgi:hypothetical protein